MEYFDVYQSAENPAHAEVVKQGFSFPGAFLGGVWALSKRMPRLGAILLGVDTAVFVAGYFAPEESLAAGLTSLVKVPIGLVVGTYGNHWWRTALERRGFTLATTIGAADSNKAMKDWRSQLEKQQEIEALRESLIQLESLQREGILSEEEYAIRRRMLVESKDDQLEKGPRIVRMLVKLDRDRPGEGFRIAAWAVGTLGVVLTVSGLWLAYFAKFWAWIAIVGGVMLAVCVCFAVVSGSRRKNDIHPGSRS
jgi:hypothetical protein